MKNSLTILMAILWSFTATTQTQTPVYLSQTITNANSRGFYRYLPADYATSTKSYPLIIWITGAGGIGQGTAADLPRVLEFGLPKIISQGGFPSSFRVNGADYSFIVISPQFMGWPSAVNVDGMINYISNNYRVDPERIYLLGLSAGGGGVWDYASASVANSDRVAAIIPFCGTSSPTQTSAGRIAASKLPVWAFHNTYDGTVPVANSRNWVNYINGYVPSPNPAAKLTEFPVQSNNAVIAHDCSAIAALPSYKPEGINIYEWLLHYKKRTTIANTAPIARAGNDISVTLPATVNLNGSASGDTDGTITAYRWRKTGGPSTYSFSNSAAVNTLVSNLSAGTYQFELSVTDNGGLTATDYITVTVYPAAADPGQGITGKTLRVNIFGGSNPYNNAQWNNWNVAGSLSSGKFNYDDGTVSSVNAVISASALIADNSATYAAAATACPPQVLRYASANTSYRTLIFYGMSRTKSYNLEFYGSRANRGNRTVFQIGNRYDTIATDNNLNDVARFINIVPDNNGRIEVIISRIGTWTYLSGFTIRENTESSLITSSARTMTEAAVNVTQSITEPTNLVVYPNPGSDIINLTMPAGVIGPYKIYIVDMNGKTMLQKSGIKNNVGYTDKMDISDLPKGMYLLRLQSQDKIMSSKIIKL